MKKIAMGIAVGLVVGLAVRATAGRCRELCETCGCKAGCGTCRRDEAPVGSEAA